MTINLANPKISFVKKTNSNSFVIIVPGFLSSPKDKNPFTNYYQILHKSFQKENVCLYIWETKSNSDLVNILLSNFLNNGNISLEGLAINLADTTFRTLSMFALKHLTDKGNRYLLKLLEPKAIKEFRNLWGSAKRNADLYSKYLSLG